MAVSHAKHSRRLAGLIAAAGLAAVVAGAAESERRNQAINLEAASSEVDYRTNKVIFRSVVISQDDITVEAERAEATGIDFENSQWTFTGDVDIRLERRGSLQSNQAIVVFRNNRIARATITGTPATFEQKLADTNRTARGRAGSIEYDVSAGTVRLSEDAWLTDGRQEISSPLIVYNVNEENVQAITAPEGSERVRIKIIPRQNDEQNDSQ